MKFTTVVIIAIFLIVISVTEVSFPFKPIRIQQNSITSLDNSSTSQEKKLLPSDFGNPYMNHYQYEHSEIQTWSICQDWEGEMIMAHRQGIIVFDGEKWETLKVPAIPIVLKAFNNEKIILLGCDTEYGYLKRNKTGVYEYHSLSGKIDLNDEITDIKITDSYIYFFSEKSLSRHLKSNLKFDKSWTVSKGDIQNGIVQIDNDIFISVQNKGLYKFNADDKKVYIPKSSIVSQKAIAFSIPLSKKSSLIGTFANVLYTFNGEKISEFSTPAQKYISESQLTGGIDLTDDYFAISTITGGSVILNKKNGETYSILDIKNGLPDNEIYALGNDSQGGLWLSHSFGISRVNYNLPVKDFNNYPGIDGSILDVVVLNKRLYVATNQGIYYQDSVVQLKETEKVIKKTNNSSSKNKPEISKSNQGKEISEDDKSIIDIEKTDDSKAKKSLLQKWKAWREERKKKKKDAALNQPQTEDKVELSQETIDKKLVEGKKTDLVNKNNTSKNNKKVERKVRKPIVWAVNYIFRKVENINGKCKQLIKLDDRILVASNNGLYEISDITSKIILKNNYINFILPSKSTGIFYIGTDKGITAIKNEKDKWVEYPDIQPVGFNDPVYTIAEDENMNLWIGNNKEVLNFIIGKNLTTISVIEHDFGNEYPENFSVRQIDNSIYFLSSNQIYRFNTSTNKIEKNNQLIDNKQPYLRYIVSQHNITWLQNEKGWKCISARLKPGKFQILLLNLFENIQDIYVDENSNLWLIDGKNNLYKILSNYGKSTKDEFKVQIKQIKNDQGKLVLLNDINIASEINSLVINTSAPYYLKPSGNTYQYFIKGIMNDWSEWKPNKEFDFFVQPGEYKLQVRARNVIGDICISKEYKLVVNYPIWKETWFLILAMAGIVLFIAIFIILLQKKHQKKLQKDNKVLEDKVEERTIEIVKQKELIEFKNREITDSLNYASQIQSAVLPPLKILKELLDDYFVFNRPKDIVSGDFYWLSEVNKQLVVTAADCTGHGVPGAFLSLLGVTFLNEITNRMENPRANLILEFLRDRVIKSLNQGGYNRKRLDGIDLSLVIIDFSKMELQFAGANNSIYIIRNGFLSEFKGNRMPIGLHAHSHIPFTNNDIEIKKGDIVYLFSDGYMDQFGGEFGRKFLSRNLKSLLTEIYILPMQEQQKILSDIIESWKGDYEQIDDILVIGLKV